MTVRARGELSSCWVSIRASRLRKLSRGATRPSRLIGDRLRPSDALRALAGMISASQITRPDRSGGQGVPGGEESFGVAQVLKAHREGEAGRGGVGVGQGVGVLEAAAGLD